MYCIYYLTLNNIYGLLSPKDGIYGLIFKCPKIHDMRKTKNLCPKYKLGF